jgi:Domain of unknown function (DUF222)
MFERMFDARTEKRGDLQGAIERFRSERLGELPDARIEDDYAELHRAIELLDAERLRRLAEIERRRSFERDGHLSAAAWVADRFRVAWGAAREQVRVSRALERMPQTRRALETGDVSMSAVRILAGACAVDAEAFAESEALLVEAARRHPIGDLHRVVTFWRDRVNRERAGGGADAARERRRLHASVTLDGMVRVDGDLDPEGGELLLTALRAVMDADARSGEDDGPSRTPPQHRADALAEICRQWLDRAERPTVAGERPHLTVTIGAESLRMMDAQLDRGARARGELIVGRDGGEPIGGRRRAARPGTRPAELDHAGPLDMGTARRLACDASVMRVVLGPRSEPLDIGRRTPVVPAAMRRAVIVRDRHCRFPGCDRPPSWSDAHHVHHWADGGATRVGNLLLLCRRHHGLVHHDAGFSVSIEGDRPVFRRPDGSEIEDRAPP